MRLIGDIRTGDESHCPKCKSATIEDERIFTLKNAFVILLLCSLLTYFFIGWLSGIFSGLAFACHLIAKKRRYEFFNLDSQQKNPD